MRTLPLAALLAGLSLGGCTEVNAVRLVVPNNAVGLSCVDSSTGRPLLERARGDGDLIEGALVLDYLALDGVPSCRAIQLVRSCVEDGCPVARRDCVDFRISPIPAPSEANAMLRTEIAHMGPITRNAPDGTVLVRAVLTSQPCAELETSGDLPAPRCDALLGCIYSCPVELDRVEGDVELELDVISGSCSEVEVGVCAGLGIPGGCT